MNLFAWLESVCLTVLVIGASKRVALLALMAGVLYTSQFQAVDLLGFNMFAIRFLEIAVFVRVVARHELSGFKLNAMDRIFLALYVYSTVVYVLRANEDIVFQIGVAVDALLVYFACRALIDSPETFRWFLRSFILLLIPFVFLVVMERFTSGGALAFTGWQPQGKLAYMVRDDRVRCLGSFRHPSLLGTISVSFIPMFIGMAFRRSDRKRAAIGVALCLIIIWAANSGGPISATAFGCLAIYCWRFRTKMRTIRWGIVASVVLLALVMKAPVWYLLDRVSAISGGGGWHRAYLMDVTFRSIGKWWFAGMSLHDTASWFAYTLQISNQADITNQFVLYGLTAGLGAVVLFVLLFVRAFSGLGKALQAVRAAAAQPSESEGLLWGMGSMVAAHIVNQLGITYFDQTHVLWYAQLAAVSSVSDWYLKTPLEPVLDVREDASDLDSQHQIEATAQ